MTTTKTGTAGNDALVAGPQGSTLIGNAIMDMGNGNTVTLVGVHTSALHVADFVIV